VITKEWFDELMGDIGSKYKIVSVEMSRTNRKALSRGTRVDLSFRKSDSDIPIELDDLDDNTVVVSIKEAL